MATLTQIRNKADAKLADFWVLLQEKQSNYFAKNGKYFQLLISPNQKVTDGIDSQFQLRQPSDERFDLDVNFTWSDTIPFQISVDEWVRGEEAGYSATVRVELLNGRVFMRTRTNTNEDTGWYKYIDIKI